MAEVKPEVDALAQAAIEVLREKYGWTKVRRPGVWDPKEIGEELVGFFGGKTLRNGRFGQYEVAIVHVPGRGAMLVSGTAIIQLVDASMVPVGHPVRIVWQGTKDLGDDRVKKLFDLLVADGEPLDEVVLPEVS